jgi:hypothetical protein
MKNDRNIVLIAKEYHTNSMKRELTLLVLGIAETDTPMKCTTRYANKEVQFYNRMAPS